ncbi:50S ribosomal protein L19 [bacterium]|nr:50S ribosomal protein L19 [bacterium]MBQ6436179.1 50S ribosomal protein L19 [bacterium]
MAQYFDFGDQHISVGDTIAVHQEVSEGNKKRIQVFEGIVIATGGQGNGKSFTVRKIASNNVAVEKIFPLVLPSIKKIVVKRRGDVRRSKLYFLRDKVGRSATRIKEKGTKTATA